MQGRTISFQEKTKNVFGNLAQFDQIKLPVKIRFYVFISLSNES
jgi:hypothetical protein